MPARLCLGHRSVNSAIGANRYQRGSRERSVNQPLPGVSPWRRVHSASCRIWRDVARNCQRNCQGSGEGCSSRPLGAVRSPRRHSVPPVAVPHRLIADEVADQRAHRLLAKKSEPDPNPVAGTWLAVPCGVRPPIILACRAPSATLESGSRHAPLRDPRKPREKYLRLRGTRKPDGRRRKTPPAIREMQPGVVEGRSHESS